MEWKAILIWKGGNGIYASHWYTDDGEIASMQADTLPIYCDKHHSTMSWSVVWGGIKAVKVPLPISVELPFHITEIDVMDLAIAIYLRVLMKLV